MFCVLRDLSETFGGGGQRIVPPRGRTSLATKLDRLGLAQRGSPGRIRTSDQPVNSRFARMDTARNTGTPHRRQAICSCFLEGIRYPYWTTWQHRRTSTFVASALPALKPPVFYRYVRGDLISRAKKNAQRPRAQESKARGARQALRRDGRRCAGFWRSRIGNRSQDFYCDCTISE
jgi:hypothetical protein